MNREQGRFTAGPGGPCCEKSRETRQACSPRGLTTCIRNSGSTEVCVSIAILWEQYVCKRHTLCQAPGTRESKNLCPGFCSQKICNRAGERYAEGRWVVQSPWKCQREGNFVMSLLPPCAQSDTTNWSWHSFCLKWVVVAGLFLFFFFWQWGWGWGRVQLAFIKKYTCLLGGNHGKPTSVLFALLLCSSSLGKVESWALFKLHHLLNIRETDTPCSLPPYVWPHQSEQKWKCSSLGQVWLFATPWTPQTPLSMEFSRQEYWRG